MNTTDEPYPAYRVEFRPSIALFRVTTPPPTVIPTDTWFSPGSQEAWDQLSPVLLAYLCWHYDRRRCSRATCVTTGIGLGFSTRADTFDIVRRGRPRLFVQYTPYTKEYQA